MFKKEISELVGKIISESDPLLQQKLAQLLEDFAELRPVAFKLVTDMPFHDELIQAMIEASDARIQN